MATDKKINYEMQGHKKPARNYLGKQKTVKNIPIKWKSGPKAPATELAYITKAEKDLILKKDLHGSLKHGPNTGPDGIMSLDAQGDYTRDMSPDAYGGPGTDKQSRDIAEQNMKNILTGQIDKGQTVKVSKRTRRGAVPEYVKVKQPDGTYKEKYVGSSIKGKQGWFRKLLGQGNVNTRGIRFEPGVGWVSEDENVGDIKPGFGGRILGGLASLLTGIPFVGGAIGGAIDKYKPKSYWEKKGPEEQARLNALSLTAPENQKSYIPKGTDMPMARNIEGFNWTDPINTPPAYEEFSPTFQNTNITGGTDVNDLQGVNFNNTNTFDANNIANLIQNSKNNLSPSFQDGGRAGYRNGEFVDENINVEGPNFDVNENVEMAEGPSPFEMRIEELMDEGMSWQEAYEIASQEFSSAEGGEDSFNQEGIASIV